LILTFGGMASSVIVGWPSSQCNFFHCANVSCISGFYMFSKREVILEFAKRLVKDSHSVASGGIQLSHCFKFSIVLQHSFSISTILKTLMKKVLNLKLMGILHVSSRHLHHPSKFLNLNELSSVKKSKSNVSGYLVVLW
jgi:hypothetical protein